MPYTYVSLILKRSCRADMKRPDGVTLLPWSRGRCLLWDATCPDTLGPSHLNRTSVETGAAARVVESPK